jgi:putative sigma-54 modulation protein
MKLMVTGRHVDVTEAVRQQIETKLKRLERLLNDKVVSIQCVLSQQRGEVVSELTVHAKEDHILHGIGRDVQLIRAVRLSVDKVAQQAQRLKDRWKTRKRVVTPALDRRAQPADERVADDAPAPRVIRSRQSPVKPMSLDDAMLTLRDGAQSFLVFRDAGSESVSILYRRPDGHFGLIEPEV